MNIYLWVMLIGGMVISMSCRESRLYQLLAYNVAVLGLWWIFSGTFHVGKNMPFECKQVQVQAQESPAGE